jgi:hypothetical protein
MDSAKLMSPENFHVHAPPDSLATPALKTSMNVQTHHVKMEERA